MLSLVNLCVIYTNRVNWILIFVHLVSAVETWINNPQMRHYFSTTIDLGQSTDVQVSLALYWWQRLITFGSITIKDSHLTQWEYLPFLRPSFKDFNNSNGFTSMSWKYIQINWHKYQLLTALQFLKQFFSWNTNITVNFFLHVPLFLIKVSLY